MTDNKKDICNDIDEKKVAWKVLKTIGMVILGIAVAILFGFIIMWLWNWLMPQIFTLKKINYWQALGIFVLAKILFGGFNMGSSKSESDDKGTIKGTIKKEIKKEFDKEFDKKSEQSEDDHNENQDYDKMYDSWWEKEGEKSFENYMNDNK